MRAYSETVGATDGNIIAAIITTHTPRNQPSAPSAGPRALVHPGHAVRGRPPGDGGEREQQRDEAEAGAHGGERGREAPLIGDVPAAAADLPRPRQAAQANFEEEKPALPSYSTPNALMFERVALEMVSSEPAGWKMPVSSPSGLRGVREWCSGTRSAR